MTATVFTVARVVGAYEGDELYAVCTDQPTAQRAVAAIWAQDPIAYVQITELLVDTAGPDARVWGWRGDCTDYDDDEEGPRWRTL